MSELYFLQIDEELPENYEKLLALISADKRTKVERYKFNIDKKLSLYADILIRYLICKSFNIKNRELYFSRNEYGKPLLLNHLEFYYNISHTRNAICVGTSSSEIGVDVEKIKKAEISIAKRFFTPDEAAYVFNNDKIQDSRFYEIWTKKEAYIKYTGQGLGIPLHSFSVISSFNSCNIHSCFENGYILSVCININEAISNLLNISETTLLTYAQALVE